MSIDTWTDPILDEIRKIREQMAREADYDVHKLGARIMESQKRHGDKLVSRQPEAPAEGKK